MKLSTLATLLPVASAVITLTDMPDTLKIGESYKIEWTMDTKYTLELLLVEKGEPPVAWSPAKTFFEGVKGKPHNGSYVVTLDETWPVSTDGQLYAFWLNGLISKKGGGWADITNWFTIEKDSSDKDALPGAGLHEQPELRGLD